MFLDVGCCKEYLTYKMTSYSVNPIYFVCFTTATIIASAILFQGFNTDSPVNVASLMSGFIIIFTGVYLLDTIALEKEQKKALHGALEDDLDEDETFLMGEATLFDESDIESSPVNLSGLNHHDMDDDIELISKPT